MLLPAGGENDVKRPSVIPRQCSAPTTREVLVGFYMKVVPQDPFFSVTDSQIYIFVQNPKGFQPRLRTELDSKAFKYTATLTWDN